jgi:hypothetical protein
MIKHVVISKHQVRPFSLIGFMKDNFSQPWLVIFCREVGRQLGYFWKQLFLGLKCQSLEILKLSFFLENSRFKSCNVFEKRGSARHLYVVYIYGAICQQTQNYFPPDPAVFSPKNVIVILFYVVSRFMKKVEDFMAK